MRLEHGVRVYILLQFGAMCCSVLHNPETRAKSVLCVLKFCCSVVQCVAAY